MLSGLSKTSVISVTKQKRLEIWYVMNKLRQGISRKPDTDLINDTEDDGDREDANTNKYLNGSQVTKKMREIEKRITFVFLCLARRLGWDTRFLCKKLLI